MKPKYGLVTYATDTNVLIRVSDAESSNADWVTEKLNGISYEGQVRGVVGGDGGKFAYFGVREVKGSRVLCETPGDRAWLAAGSTGAGEWEPAGG